jgi:hypothetical protein
LVGVVLGRDPLLFGKTLLFIPYLHLLTSFVQPNLQYTCLKRNLHPAASQYQRALHSVVGDFAHVFSCLCSSMTRSANRSASAAIVRLGLGPTGPGITEPSATYKRS